MPRLAVMVACVLVASSARAEDEIGNAASQVAREVLEAAAARLQHVPGRVMLVPLTVKNEDAVTAEFQAALVKAVIAYPGVRVVDKQALEAVLKEQGIATLNGDSLPAQLSEIAGAFGAELWLMGSLDKFGGTYRANARAVAAGTGNVLASSGISFTLSGKQDATSTRLDAQLRMLADQLAGGLDRLEGEARYQRFAVLPFSEVGKTTSDKQLGTLVTSELSTLLRRDHDLLLVEREQISRIMDELALGQTGVVAAEHSIEVGRLSGADALILGTVSEAGDSYLVNGRVVAAATGDVVLAEKVRLPAGDLIALSSEAVVLRSKSGAFFRSLLVPGWGQFYNREPIKGGIFTGAVALAVGAALAFHFRGQSLEDEYDKLDAGSAKFELKADQASDAYRTRNYIFIGVAALHVFNIIDAVLNGYSPSSPNPT